MTMRSIVALALLAVPALARTDLAGCTYTDTVVLPSGGTPYASRIWYVPGTGELCEFLDCGGGMAPPKTTVPGCPLYSGTATYSPSYLDLKTTEAAATSAPATASAAASTTAIVTATGKPSQPTSTEAATQKTETAVTTVVVPSTEAESQPTSTEAVSQSAIKTVTKASASSSGVAKPSSSSAANSTSAVGVNSANAPAPMGVTVFASYLIAGVVVFMGMM